MCGRRRTRLTGLVILGTNVTLSLLMVKVKRNFLFPEIAPFAEQDLIEVN